mmetsp:Transcript_13267/g.31221  ORF Transcript_13267/g.31221 Transcript_13267/m.31221 type:complete len:228 (+) Transcript_13267:426-1109(+)
MGLSRRYFDEGRNRCKGSVLEAQRHRGTTCLQGNQLLPQAQKLHSRHDAGRRILADQAGDEPRRPKTRQNDQRSQKPRHSHAHGGGKRHAPDPRQGRPVSGEMRPQKPAPFVRKPGHVPRNEPRRGRRKRRKLPDPLGPPGGSVSTRRCQGNASDGPSRLRSHPRLAGRGRFRPGQCVFAPGKENVPPGGARNSCLGAPDVFGFPALEGASRRGHRLHSEFCLFGTR